MQRYHCYGSLVFQAEDFEEHSILATQKNRKYFILSENFALSKREQRYVEDWHHVDSQFVNDSATLSLGRLRVARWFTRRIGYGASGGTRERRPFLARLARAS